MRTLKEGTINYSEKSKEFNSALKQVSKGISSANSSYTEINSAIAFCETNASLELVLADIRFCNCAIWADWLPKLEVLA